MSQTSYSLTEISNWAKNNKKFNLPNVQRGFVWKPYQIEDLWDSILRGYPIGCFVLSKSPKSGNEKYEILDGQQRATSIALGFDSKTFRDTDQNIKLFIDLGYTQTDKDDKKYSFRVITKSHPWGYEKRDNTRTLDADKKRVALNIYGVENHLDKSLNLFFPYEAILPVPFSFLINSETFEEALIKIKKWKLFAKIKQHFLSQNPEFVLADFDLYMGKLLTRIMDVKKSMIKEYPNIPALYLNLDKFINADVSEEGNELPGKNEEDNYDETSNEMENLFIRLNNHGTPLRGEELNYSILKAHINKNLQNEIEAACEHFIRPARFVAILFRVFSNEPGSKSLGNISLKIKAKVFQRAISENRSAFTDYIKNVLVEKNYDGQTLLDYARNILAYHPQNNKYGFPYSVYTRFAEASPEVMVAFLFRLKVMGDRFDEPNSIIQRKMLGTISLLFWLGKGEKNRDYTKVLRNIWPSVSKIDDAKVFWSKATLNRARINDVMSFFPNFTGRNGFRSFLNKRAMGKRRDREPFLLSDEEEILLPFINATLYNKDLIAYSQRDFLHQQFKPTHYGLEDTNVPFDWDHISPQNAIAIRPVPIPIESVYNTIGNLRAWPYSLNRIDQAITPFMKFCPLEGYTREVIQDLLKDYQGLLKTTKTFKNKFELRNEFLTLSVCDIEWANCNADKLKDRYNWLKVYLLILKRTMKLYQNWYDALLIDDLQPVNSQISFDSLFYKGKWHKNPKTDKTIEEYFDYGSYNYWLSNQILPNTYLYFGFKIGMGLAQDNFSFGLLEKPADGVLTGIEIPEILKNKYAFFPKTELNDLQGYFTLISTETTSYKILLRDIYIWIDAFPDKKIKSCLLDFFDKCLKKENKNYFTKSKI